MAERDTGHSAEPEAEGSPEVKYVLTFDFPNQAIADKFLDNLAASLMLAGIDGPSINKRVSADKVVRDESGQEVLEHVPQIGPRQ